MRTFGMIAVLTMSGCLSPESHRLLENDGSSEEDGGSGATSWTSCADAADMASHMDLCSGWEGHECGANATVGRADVATCIAGRVLKASVESTGWGDPSVVCTDPLTDGIDRVQVVTAAGGCADLWVCTDSDAARRTACQLDPLPDIRPDATGSVPWTDCDAALRNGMDGDPCEGELRCLGQRSSSNPLLVFCDAGILRMIPMQSAIHSLD